MKRFDALLVATLNAGTILLFAEEASQFFFELQEFW